MGAAMGVSVGSGPVVAAPAFALASGGLLGELAVPRSCGRRGRGAAAKEALSPHSKHAAAHAPLAAATAATIAGGLCALASRRGQGRRRAAGSQRLGRPAISDDMLGFMSEPGEKVTLTADGSFEVTSDLGKMAFEATSKEDGTLDFLADPMEITKEINEKPTGTAVVLKVVDDVAVCRQGIGFEPISKSGTVVQFANGGQGVVLAWKEQTAVVQLLAGFHVEVGEQVMPTPAAMCTAAGISLRGRIVDPRGRPIDGLEKRIGALGVRPTFAEYKAMGERTSDYRPLHTGVLGVDFAAPIGRGQTMLFQGTVQEADKEHLWPDLLAVQTTHLDNGSDALNVCVCETLEVAIVLRDKMEARGALDRCIFLVADSQQPGAGMIAINAAVSIAEQACFDDGAEVMVVLGLQPMYDVWGILADAAGKERRDRGVNDEDALVDLQGTMVTESISARRKFWFALISRAVNSNVRGSVSLLPWCWEKEGGRDQRSMVAYSRKLQAVHDIPRIPAATRAKMAAKLRSQALAEGFEFPEGDSPLQVVTSDESGWGPGPGVPNFEIEELKSISDGHILLKPSGSEQAYHWIVDPYKSLPRLGTDALHPALIAMNAHMLRLRMMQGHDRAVKMHDTLDAPLTLNFKDRVDLRHIEMMLQQPAGKPLLVEEQVARLAIVASPATQKLTAEGDFSAAAMAAMAGRLLESEVGKSVASKMRETGYVTVEMPPQLLREVASWLA